MGGGEGSERALSEPVLRTAQNAQRFSPPSPAAGERETNAAQLADDIDAPRPVLGWCIFLCAVAAWASVVYATLLAKALPPTGLAALDWARGDVYYCHLLPAAVPTLVALRYWSWLSAEFFKNA